MDTNRADRAEAQLRVGVYGRLSETYDAAESVPTQLDRVDVVIVHDIDRLTRNLTDWNAFEKACVRHGVRLSAYTGGDLDLSTAEGAYYGGMETLRARRESGQERRGPGGPGPGGAQGPPGASGGSGQPPRDGRRARRSTVGSGARLADGLQGRRLGLIGGWFGQVPELVQGADGECQDRAGALVDHRHQMTDPWPGRRGRWVRT
jgi:resolvase-like protein